MFLELLGYELYGALKICENFEVVKCPHSPLRTAAQCMEHMGRRSKNPVHQKFILASQDEQLLFSMRDFGGIPLMSIRFNAIQLEKVTPKISKFIHICFSHPKPVKICKKKRRMNSKYWVS